MQPNSFVLEVLSFKFYNTIIGLLVVAFYCYISNTNFRRPINGLLTNSSKNSLENVRFSVEGHIKMMS